MVAKLGLDEVSCLVCALSKKLLAGTEKTAPSAIHWLRFRCLGGKRALTARKHSSLIKTEIDYALGKPQSAV